jgi:hypothetical protein
VACHRITSKRPSWPGLLLRDDCPRGNSIAVTRIAHPQTYRITRAQLTIDAEVEHRELAQPSLRPEANSNRQDSLSLNGAFWPTNLPLFHGAWHLMTWKRFIVISFRLKRSDFATIATAA